MQINVPVFDIGFKHNVHNNFGNDLLKMEIILNFIIELLFGKSSDFYFEMYSKNLIDDGFSASAEIGRTFSFTVISGSSLNSEIVREKLFLL